MNTGNSMYHRRKLTDIVFFSKIRNKDLNDCLHIKKLVVYKAFYDFIERVYYY